MKRRAFLGSAVAMGAGAVAAPAVAQTSPQVRWRMTSTFPKAADISFGAGETFCRYVSEITDGRFVIQQFAAGEVVPGFQALDATQNGTVEAAYTGLLFYIGKSPVFPLTASAPFMMNPRAQNAWYYHGGGLAMTNEFLKGYNIVGYPCGNTGMQWGGWFKKEIKTVDDLKGLKMRIAGLAGVIAARVGVVPQQIAPGDIYPALERGTIDALEYIGPYDDEKLGLQKIVQRYYSPGWQEGGTMFHTIFNHQKFEELPTAYKKAIEIAAQAVTLDMLANYDQKNPEAMLRLVAQGVKISVFPNEVLSRFHEEAEAYYKETCAANPVFAKMFNHQREFMKKSYTYQRVSDFQYDLMMMRLRP
jgi:TRAP-type mannitol/chloroaromatic compound transport system substrate-binding protein